MLNRKVAETIFENKTVTDDDINRIAKEFNRRMINIENNYLGIAPQQGGKKYFNPIKVENKAASQVNRKFINSILKRDNTINPKYYDFFYEEIENSNNFGKEFLNNELTEEKGKKHEINIIKKISKIKTLLFISMILIQKYFNLPEKEKNTQKTKKNTDIMLKCFMKNKDAQKYILRRLKENKKKNWDSFIQSLINDNNVRKYIRNSIFNLQTGGDSNEKRERRAGYFNFDQINDRIKFNEDDNELYENIKIYCVSSTTGFYCYNWYKEQIQYIVYFRE